MTSSWLEAIARGHVVVDAGNRMQLRRLAREDLRLAGFGAGVVATVLPRGRRLVAIVHGELPNPLGDARLGRARRTVEATGTVPPRSRGRTRER